MFPGFLLVLTYFKFVLTIDIGRMSQARLVSTTQSKWLYEQFDSDTCMCNAMKFYGMNIVALNYFSKNYSCQIFDLVPSMPEIVPESNAIFIFRRSFPNLCCSNLPWIIRRLQNAQKTSVAGVKEPSSIDINPINNLIAVMSYKSKRFLLSPTDITNVVNKTTVGQECAIAAYSGTLFISSCDVPQSVRIYNETSSGLLLLNVINVTNNPRQVVMLYNNTQLLVPIQYQRRIEVYLINLTTNTFVYNQSISIPRNVVWTMTKQNETFIYICFWESGSPVYTLSFTNSKWILGNLTGITTSASEIPTQVDIDSCGRLWIIFYGYGIRIYDPTGQTLLASWANGTGSADALFIKDNYQVFLGDYDNNKVHLYNPNIQCTLS